MIPLGIWGHWRGRGRAEEKDVTASRVDAGLLMQGIVEERGICVTSARNTCACQCRTLDKCVIRFPDENQIKQHLLCHPHRPLFHIPQPRRHLPLLLKKGHSSSLWDKCHFPCICLHHLSLFTFIWPSFPKDRLQASQALCVSEVRRVCI